MGSSPVPFTRTSLSKDGRTLHVFFPTGEGGCDVLDEVETEFVGSDTLRVTVFLGTRRKAADGSFACTSIGIPSVAEVDLPKSANGRTVVDGNRTSG